MLSERIGKGSSVKTVKIFRVLRDYYLVKSSFHILLLQAQESWTASQAIFMKQSLPILPSVEQSTDSTSVEMRFNFIPNVHEGNAPTHCHTFVEHSSDTMASRDHLMAQSKTSHKLEPHAPNTISSI